MLVRSLPKNQCAPPTRCGANRHFSVQKSRSWQDNARVKWCEIKHWYFQQVQDEKVVIFPTKEQIEEKQLKIRESHEKMQKLAKENPTFDKIMGSIYGNALGDAVGLSTEFLSTTTSQILYGSLEDKSVIPFPNFLLNAHNQYWFRGDWSDDTDQLILIMQTLLETGKADPITFAKKLDLWILEGFPELGDDQGEGVGALVSTVVGDPDFLADPAGTALKIWDEKTGKTNAPNGAVMRTAILGCWEYWDLNKVEKNTLDICKVTHADPRCAASCLAISIATALILQGHPCRNADEISTIFNRAKNICDIAMWNEPKDNKNSFEHYFVRDATVESLKHLDLGHSKGIGYTFKTMGSGIWGLYSERNFKDTLTMISRCGGDADTNGAVCGAMWGVRHGYSQLPEDWLLSMPDKIFLDNLVQKYLEKCKPSP